MVKCVICGKETGSDVINICQDCLEREEEFDKSSFETALEANWNE